MGYVIRPTQSFYDRRASVKNETQRKVTRRHFLRTAGYGAAALLTAACGGEIPTGNAPRPASTAAGAEAGAAATTGPAAGTGAAATGAPALVTKGETLKIALIGTSVGQQFEKSAAAFKAKYPEVTIQFTP